MSLLLLLRRTLLRTTVNHRLSFSTTTPTTVTTAVSILTNHRSKSRWSTIKATFPSGLTPHQISQITLHLRNNPRLALRFFHHSFRHSTPSLHAFSTIIHVLARARLRSQTRTLTRLAIRASDGRHLVLFKILAQSYTLCDSSPFVFDFFINCLLEFGYLDSALRVVRKFHSRVYENYVSVGTINALISTAARRKGSFFAYDLFKEMFLGGNTLLLPNVGSFNELLVAFHRDGVVDMVEEVWIEMVKVKCSGNCFSYCVLMERYWEDEDVLKARGAWDEMKLKGVQPDNVAYNIMIGGYCRTGEVEKGEELYREMVVSGLEGGCVTYQHLVNGYCEDGDVDSAMLLYKDMRRKGHYPDTCTIDAIVSLLCDKSSVVEALEFFNGVVGDADFVAKETSYERLIKGLCGVRKMEDALKLQAEMVGKGFGPNEDIYGAFIEGYVKGGQSDVAERLRKEFMGMQAN